MNFSKSNTQQKDVNWVDEKKWRLHNVQTQIENQKREQNLRDYSGLKSRNKSINKSYTSDNSFTKNDISMISNNSKKSRNYKSNI